MTISVFGKIQKCWPAGSTDGVRPDASEALLRKTLGQRIKVRLVFETLQWGSSVSLLKGGSRFKAGSHQPAWEALLFGKQHHGDTVPACIPPIIVRAQMRMGSLIP